MKQLNFRAGRMLPAVFCLTLSTLAVFPALLAQDSAPSPTATIRHSASLDVKKMSENASGSTTYQSSYSREREYVRAVSLDINVRNFANNPDQYTVEWFFIGKKASGSSRFIYDTGKKELDLKAGAYEKFQVVSKELTSSTYRGYYYRSNSGEKPDGWIVRVLAEGKTIAMKASSPVLEATMKDESAMIRLIEGSSNRN